MKSFSELTSASYVSNSDILAISQENSGTYSSKKTTVKEVSDFANQNFAEEYDSTSSYAVGDYCIYESVLYKCIGTTTGTFDSTKWTSVVVTNEMGSGGGGTGGHTIIDENGNSMTARAGLQFVGANVDDDATNNKTIVDIASAGGIDGVFIDTENVIKSATEYTGNISYTATEDCVFAYDIVSTSSASGWVKIDNVSLKRVLLSNGNIMNTDFIFVKKGQTVSLITQTAGGWSVAYTVYGIQTGTTHSKFQPVIYSTEEREIGVWTDGKPLYEKTIDCGALPNNTTKTVSHGISNFEHMVGYSGVAFMPNINDIPIPFVHNASLGDNVCFFIDSSEITLRTSSDKSGYTASYITLRYTKTTDTAGSGSWTPQGVPTHHYSTDEQVIGTWIDGSTLYEKIFNFTVNKSSSHTFNFTDGNIKRIVDGYIINSLNSISFPVNASWESKTEEFLYDATHLYLNTSANIGNNSTLQVIVQYTKSS